MTRHAFSTTDLNRLERQLSAWRQKRTGRTRLPEAVWGAATELARTQGPSLVARALRLHYYKLRQRMTATSSSPTVPATFVEVKGAPLAGADGGESSVELVDGTGARMTLRVRSDLATLVALAQSFWRRRR
jgi:hypothetical protein